MVQETKDLKPLEVDKSQAVNKDPENPGKPTDMKSPNAENQPKKEEKKQDPPIEDEGRFMDHKYMGEQFPRPWGVRGPLPNGRRTFTDVICCAVFLLYCIFMILLVVVTCANARVQDIGKIMDSEANKCGEKDFAAYPYLLMFKFSAPYKSVCVKSCPKFDYNQIRYNSGGTNASVITPVLFADISNEMETGIIQCLQIREEIIWNKIHSRKASC